MKKFTRILSIGLAAALSVMLGTSCTRQARKTRALAQADRSFAAGQYDQAEIEYLNALKLEALNPQAIGQLGLIYYAQGRVGRASPFLLKGRELQPENLELRQKLGMLQLGTGHVKEARAEADFILARKPQDAEAPLLLAETAVAPTDMEEVRKRLQSLPPPAAGGAPVLVALGTLDLRQRNLKDAEAAFKRAVELDPKSSAAHAALGTLYRVQGDMSKAEEELKKAADLSPTRSPRRLYYAQFKIQSGDLAAGKRLLDEINLATPDYLPAWIWQAEITAAQKKYDESAAFVAKVLARDSMHPEAMLLSARLKLARNEPAKAVAELERMATIYRQAPQVHYQLGLAYLAAGDTAKAMTSLTQAVTLAPGFAEAIVVLAELQIRQGELNLAIVALKKLVQQRPDLPQARLLLADAYRGQGNLDEALGAYRQLEAQYPKNPQTPLLTGLVLLQQKKPDDARMEFEKALALAPNYLPALEQLVDLDLTAKQYAAARERVEKQMAKDPKQPGPQLLLAKISLAEKDANGTEAALKKAIELQPDSPNAYYLLARLYLATNQQQKALTNLQEVVAKNPKATGAQMLIGVIHEQQKDYAAARDAYEKLLTIDPKMGTVMNNLAWLYAEHFDQLDKAFDLAQKARELQPNEPHLADTLGWVLYRKHQYPWALNLLTESAGKLPTEAEVQYHLGMTHYMLGEEEPARLALERSLQLSKDFTGREEASQRLDILKLDVKTAGPDARAMLEKVVAERKDDPVGAVRLAAILERSGASDKAISTLETARPANPNNVSILTNLARLYATRQDNPKALELAKAARKLAPDDATIAHTVGRLAFRTGDFKWAASVLQEAALKQADDPEVQYDLAQASYAVGKVADAQAAAQSALALNATFSRAADAQRFLDLVALSSNPDDAVAATAKIEQALKANPDDVPALMAMAAISEKKLDASAAKKTYNKVLSLFPDFIPAKRCLAILYAANPEDDQKAYDLAMKARQALPDDAEVAKALGIITYRQGDAARAASLLQESASKLADDPLLTYYLGMSQFQLKRTAESKKTLQRALELHLTGDLAGKARETIAGIK